MLCFITEDDIGLVQISITLIYCSYTKIFIQAGSKE